jgi:uncharacterized protein YvpB
MVVLARMMKYSFSILLVIGLAFSSGVFSVLLYGKITGKDWAASYGSESAVVYAEKINDTKPITKPTKAPAVPKPVEASVMLTAPLIKQNPELPSGCEITTLTMLLQFYGIKKDKMQLVPEMKYDTTPMKTDANGNIIYWGNPNSGFVGNITGQSKGFGIYHTALFELLRKYIPTAIDLTRTGFDVLERKVASGIPVEVWTTVDYLEPMAWVEWDSPLGPIRTTFAEHAVLLVGYDKDNVFVNDPLSGKSNVRIDKALFVQTWESMGKQAISYN